ncbi:MAG: lysophospholipid acyltransferase family protein [Candidatus Omnitrophica bacterium]|nr:lysophospholipid acyltransferase family protein [Candidatus Omnitrophota bacterium]
MIYWVLRALTVFTLRVFFGLKVEGLKNLPKKTNFIIVANHTSFLDPFVIGAAIPQRVYWLAIQEFYRSPWTRWFMLTTETLPVGNASEKLVYLLNRNRIVGLFPEGTRTHDGKLREFKRGAALLSYRTGRPIVPCAIMGAQDALPVKAKFPKFVPLKIKIGRPQYLLKEYDDQVDDVYLQEGTLQIQNAIKEMLYA